MNDAHPPGREQGPTYSLFAPLTVYHDPYFDLPAVKLLPGDGYATTRDLVMVTVLGSCVSACIHDPVAGVGGMNHFMLPGHSSAPRIADATRHGVVAMEQLLALLLRLGAEHERLVAKVFGGARMLGACHPSDVGERNAAFVMQYLAERGIPVVSGSMGGSYSRKLYFFPRRDKVLVKTLEQLGNGTLIERESAYEQRLG